MLRSDVHFRKAKKIAINNLFSNGDEEEHVETVILPDGNVSDCDLEGDDIENIPTNQPENIVCDPQESGDQEILAVDEIAASSDQFVYRWRRLNPPIKRISWDNEHIQSSVDDKTPYQRFKEVFTDDLLIQIAQESNRYSVEKTAESINATFQEYEIFFGILLFSTIMDASEFRMYWRTDLRWPVIADAMPMKRFEILKRYFHLADNAKAKKYDDPSYDPLHKIRPLLDHILQWCKSLELTQHQSIDEMMVPFKGRTKFKQYMPKKPTKWGFKVFARCSENGIVHDFIIYCGSKTSLGKFANLSEVGFGGKIVLSLCDSLPRVANFKIFSTVILPLQSWSFICIIPDNTNQLVQFAPTERKDVI